MQVVENSLVEYFESCRSDLLRQGFHVLILALVREADAPLFYDDLIRYWDSINDVTSRHAVFAVAGWKAAENVGFGAIYGNGYCEQMTVADQHTLKIERLRALAGPRRNIKPYLGSIAEANTGQISELCQHLGVEERDLPCLHLTHLGSGKALTLSYTGSPGTTVYTTCKAIISHLQPSFRLFDKAGNVVHHLELPAMRRDEEAFREKLLVAKQRLSILDEVPNAITERDSLTAYFRMRLTERADTTPIEFCELISICEKPDRAANDDRHGTSNSRSNITTNSSR